MREARISVRLDPCPEYVAKVMYAGIMSRVGHAKHYKDIRCTLSLTDFEAFITAHWKEYLHIHNGWQVNNFQVRYSPSLDRINPLKDYSLENIQLLPQHENVRRAIAGKKQSPEHKAKRLAKVAEFYRNKHMSV